MSQRKVIAILKPLIMPGLMLLVMVSATMASMEDPVQAFMNPPEAAKPGVWWHWMGCNVSKEGITRDLESLKSAGFGMATIFGMADVCTPWAGQIDNSPTAGLVAFTDTWWALVRHAAAEGKRLGLEIGIHNCPGYESSGGPWITAELSMLEICYSETPAKGPGLIQLTLPQPKVDPRSTQSFPVFNPETGKVEQPIMAERREFYRDIAVIALPAEGEAGREQVMDLTGNKEWEVPAGKWIIYRFGYTTQGKMTQPNQWAARGLECDKMSAEAVEFHISRVLGDMKRNLGDLAGSGLQFVLFDSYEAGSPTWTPRMREEFKARRGYGLTQFLATFAGRTVGSTKETDQFKADFNRTIEDLYRDVYFATVQRMLRAAGLRFACEPYGGPWRVGEVAPYVDRVMAEFWTSGGSFSGNVPGGILNGGNGVFHNILEAEAFTGSPEESQWTESPAWLKPVGDGAFLAGINRLVLHHCVHQPWDDNYRPGMAMGRWGTHFGRHQTWWEPGKAWVQYLSRCQALLQWGSPARSDCIVESDLPLRSIHRRGETVDIFFVVNSARSGGVAQCWFEVKDRQPECWDPVTGTRRDLTDYEAADGGTLLPLEFSPAQSYFVVFRKAPGLKTIESRANFPALKQQVELTGAWEVSFDSRWGGPEKPVRFETLVDWTSRSEAGIRYYSGTAVYRKAFDLPSAVPASDSMELELGTVNHLARVRLNGQELGVVWCAPWRVVIPAELLKNGVNQLEIEITNVWANRLIGDEQEPADCQWKPGDMAGGSYLKQFPDWFVNKQPRPSRGRYCFTTWNYFTKDSPLAPSGLLGPVRLMSQDWTRPARVPAAQSKGTIKRRINRDSTTAFEMDVLKEGLVSIVKIADEKVAHQGGGTDASALVNGTTKNGSGGDETRDDGKTFRGYGAGSVVIFKLDGAHDLTGIRSFAGHSDGRASQNYTVLVATAGNPEKFDKLLSAAVPCEGGSSELCLTVKASGVVAVRLEFQDGPLGFNVYREINITGKPVQSK